MFQIFYVFELVVIDFIWKCVVNVIQFAFVNVNVFWWNEFIFWIIEYTDLINKIGYFVLIIAIHDIIELNKIFWQNKIIIHNKP